MTATDDGDRVEVVVGRKTDNNNNNESAAACARVCTRVRRAIGTRNNKNVYRRRVKRNHHIVSSKRDVTNARARTSLTTPHCHDPWSQIAESSDIYRLCRTSRPRNPSDGPARTCCGAAGAGGPTARDGGAPRRSDS